MFEFAFAEPFGPDSMTDILNRATSYYLAAIAVAIGFRMGLFNIGVDGQYRLATLLAGALGAASFLILAAGSAADRAHRSWWRWLVGAAWAGIAALLKVYRGVSEVISTIMLNFIGGSLFAYLLTTDRLAVQPAGSQNVTHPAAAARTCTCPASRCCRGRRQTSSASSCVAGLVGFAYWFLLGRTRFGFDLRATGMNPSPRSPAA